MFFLFSKATLILQDIDKEAEKLNFVWKPRAGPDPLAGYLMSPAQQKQAETSGMGSVHEEVVLEVSCVAGHEANGKTFEDQRQQAATGT